MQIKPTTGPVQQTVWFLNACIADTLRMCICKTTPH